MAFSYGRQFRRIAAQALAADPDEMRALIERILPARAEGAAPALRLETEADYKIAPAAIVFAFFADAISGDAAADLLRQTENPAFRKRALEERRAAEDPMAPSYRVWREASRGYELAVQGDRLVRVPYGTAAAERRSAANEARGLVNNNENTSAACDDAAAPAPERPP
jgi:hypothetical protein